MTQIDTVDAFNEVLAYYCTTTAGEFRYANDALVKLLGYESFEELRKVKVDNLYVDKASRLKWLKKVFDVGKTDMPIQYRLKDGRTIYVRDIATLRPLGASSDDSQEQEVEGVATDVVGFLVPINHEQNREIYYQGLSDTADALFDQAKVGIVKLDCETNLFYANEYMKKEFPEITSVTDGDMPLGSLFTDPDDRLSKALDERALGKSVSSEPIPVTMQLPGGEPTPVSVQLFYITSERMEKPKFRTATVCKIQNLRLPDSIEQFLLEYGPRHPLLEKLKIKTIIKRMSVSDRGATEFRFEWANQSFLAEVGKTLEEIKGQRDMDLFPKHFDAYHKRDIEVMTGKRTIQTIEQHPVRLTDKHEYVFVLKTTVKPYDKVLVFYWEYSAGAFDRMCGRLSSQIGKMYVDILDRFPFPVFVRNETDRFVYVNSAYCQHIERLRLDVIGSTDEELFKPELAQEYLTVDNIVREQAKDKGQPFSLTREERNMDAEGRVSRVVVTKAANENGTIEGVFWGKNDIEVRLAKGVDVLHGKVPGQEYRRGIDIFISYALEDRESLTGPEVTQSRKPNGELLAQLSALSHSHPHYFNEFDQPPEFYRTWMDADVEHDWRKEIERAMAECKYAIILLSANYLDNDGYAYGVELPELLNRAENDPRFHLEVVHLSPFPRNPADPQLGRLNRQPTANRKILKDDRFVCELEDADRQKFWATIAESALRHFSSDSEPTDFSV